MQSKIELKLVTKDYDFLMPLVSGDVVTEGIRLSCDRDTPNALDRTLSDASIEVGELSFSRQLSRIANNDNSFVGIPIFPQRAFRHRCFFTKRGSGIDSFEALAGKRIGTNEWPASGNVWSRAILRHHKVSIEGIRWWVGSLEGKPSNRPQGNLPPYVQVATDKTLLSMLLDGELEALMCPHPPKIFAEKDSPVVRLLADFRSAEIDYHRSTGLFPTIHVLGVRRPTYEKNPWVLQSLFKAIEASKLHWQASRRNLSDTTPWAIKEIEDATALFGKDWYPYGVQQNAKDIQTLCDELQVQGLLARQLTVSDAFPEFEASSR